MHLERLLTIVAARKAAAPFACIRDLVRNGIATERFAPGEQQPARSDVTLFLAAWCRSAGLTQEQYQDWLIDYCTDVLAAITSSPASRIRHSTKSAIKSIHRNKVPFRCDCEKNIFKAHCVTDCPEYETMREAYRQRIEARKKEIEQCRQQAIPQPPDPETLPLKERYRKQYNEAIKKIKEHLAQGRTKKEISALLNEEGYKSITGRAWSPAIVSMVAEKHGCPQKRRRKRKKTGSPKQLPLFKS